MDSVLGVKFDGGVVLASDQSNARSILLYQTNLDKITPLTEHSVLGCSGPNCDMVNFTNYIEKNIQLYKLSNHNAVLSTAAQANFCRNELAQALRRGPYQVNCLLGGYDLATNESSLYFLDYLASLQKVNYGAQGYASNFCLSVMDKEYNAYHSVSEEQAVDIVNKCIHELHTRFLISQPNFIVKVIDKDGIRVVSQGADPQDT